MFCGYHQRCIDSVSVAKEPSEGGISLMIMFMFLLRVPIHDEAGNSNLSWLDTLTLAVQLFSTLLGLFGGAEAYHQCDMILMNPLLRFNIDRRFEHFESCEFNTNMFAASLTIVLIAGPCTLALLAHLSSGLSEALRFASGGGAVAYMFIAVVVGVGFLKIHQQGRKDGLKKTQNKAVVRFNMLSGVYIPTISGLAAVSVWWHWYQNPEKLDSLPWHISKPKEFSTVECLTLLRSCTLWLVAASVALTPFAVVCHSEVLSLKHQGVKTLATG